MNRSTKGDTMTEIHRAYAWVHGHEIVARDRVWQSTSTVVIAPVLTRASLELSDEDAALLDHVLGTYLGDLRMEIAGTDNPQMRRDLKLEERLLRAIKTRLHCEPTEAST
jgi:hypothetical protein